jgi:trans-aconitate 2-methyltransferase
VPRDWDAAEYDRLSTPMIRWGEDVVRRLELRGDERVLDAGCGGGKVTAMLLGRLPAGRAIALDGSPSMIEVARTNLRRFGDQVEFVVADLQEPLPIDGTVDAILSTATFHWIPDQDSLYRNLAAVLRPAGQLVAQCGGKGNIATVDAALRELGYDLGNKRFVTPEETRDRLQRFGFTDIEVWLNDEPTQIPPEDLEPYLRTICLGSHVEAMSPDEATAFAHELATRLPGPQIDYVRLNITARRSSPRSPCGLPIRG